MFLFVMTNFVNNIFSEVNSRFFLPLNVTVICGIGSSESVLVGVVIFILFLLDPCWLVCERVDNSDPYNSCSKRWTCVGVKV